MKGLTRRQREIIDFIQEFISNNRYSPSYREIGHHFGFRSPGSVYKHINALKGKGAVLSDSKMSRSMTLAENPLLQNIPNEIEIPFIGHITAGGPIETFTQNQYVTVPKNLVHASDKTYALRVKGDSLAEEMIADGDLIIVEARQQAHPGETIVALINGHDIIIKRYYPEGAYVRLTGAMAHHHPIILHEEDVIVQGILIGLIRRFS